jgi:arylsulfatase A-like enzyme
LGVADKTLIWFSGDNGGLRKNFGENAVGPLRGGKKDLWEGGLRVPCIIEWPEAVKPAVVKTPASTLDIAPTVVDLLDLPNDSLLAPVDGQSISRILLGNEMPDRRPIPIAIWDKAAWIDHDYKLVLDGDTEHLFDLSNDPREQRNLAEAQPEHYAEMRKEMNGFLASVKASMDGKDYPDGLTTPRRDVQWRNHPPYAKHLDQIKESLKASQTP